jgi:hypothetical protein
MSEALRELSDQLICHPVSRSIAEIEAAGEAIKSLMAELQQAREERTALLATEQNLMEDAERWQEWRKGKALTVVIPTPTDDKPSRKVTVMYGPNPEPAYGVSLDEAIDAARGVK